MNLVVNDRDAVFPGAVLQQVPFVAGLKGLELGHQVGQLFGRVARVVEPRVVDQRLGLRSKNKRW